MDIKISGSGSIASGEYKEVHISGSGRMTGLVRCDNLHVSGSARGENIECAEKIAISGSGKFSGSAKAGNVSVSGALSVDGDVDVKEKLSCSGVTNCGGSIRCATLRVSGKAVAAKDIEAERVDVDGILNCEGLVNAEEITIKYHSSGMEIGSIGGSNIVICRSQNVGRSIIRLPLFSSLANSAAGSVKIKTAIEGDNIAIEGVSAERVSGRVVAIGEGCKVDLVQYSEKIEVSPNAKVGRQEKI